MIVELLASLLAVAHGMAAGAVSVHVLLTHRDVRSSIGWIALAWLSPFFGAVLYVGFGINRVARRARQIGPSQVATKAPAPRHGGHQGATDLSPHIAALAVGGDVLADMPVVQGNKAAFLRNGDAAYPEMLAAIAGAEASVALSSYIFDDDEVGAAFIAALVAAHERGVAVRVLIDGIGGGYIRSPVAGKLREAGVTVGLFMHNWVPLRMSFINLRNHKKLLIVDGRTGFTGGMNISSSNVGGKGAPQVRDIQVRLEGPIVRQLMLSFARDWEFTTKEILAEAVWWPSLPVGTGCAMRSLAAGPDGDVARIEELWASAIEQAEHRVRIVTPYFLPEERVLDVLMRAAIRGVSVELLVPETSNHFYIDWAMRAHLGVLPLDRIICLLGRAPFDHSKLMSVDGLWSSFGSPNWDARSMRLNFEQVVECYDPGVTAEIDRIIDHKCGGAKRLTNAMLAERSLPVKLRDASARLFLPYI